MGIGKKLGSQEIGIPIGTSNSHIAHRRDVTFGDAPGASRGRSEVNHRGHPEVTSRSAPSRGDSARAVRRQDFRRAELRRVISDRTGTQHPPVGRGKEANGPTRRSDVATDVLSNPCPLLHGFFPSRLVEFSRPAESRNAVHAFSRFNP